MRTGKLRYAVDLPNPVSKQWDNIDYFETKDKAIRWAMKNLGADSKGRIQVVSKNAR
ncbi:MAG: hypothetical protein HQK96_01635 [Nitrospirae bacterium]|nr:hypothetical protein [Nitrospirota bacterium]